jgi:hypothetical protein
MVEGKNPRDSGSESDLSGKGKPSSRLRVMLVRLGMVLVGVGGIAALGTWLWWSFWDRSPAVVSWDPSSGCRLVSPGEPGKPGSALLWLREGRNRLLFDCNGETREVWVNWSY